MSNSWSNNHKPIAKIRKAPQKPLIWCTWIEEMGWTLFAVMKVKETQLTSKEMKDNQKTWKKVKKQWVKISNSDWTGAIAFSLRRLHVPEHHVQIERYRPDIDSMQTWLQTSATLQEACKKATVSKRELPLLNSIKTLPNSRINMIQLYKHVFRAGFSLHWYNRCQLFWYGQTRSSKVHWYYMK